MGGTWSTGSRDMAGSTATAEPRVASSSELPASPEPRQPRLLAGGVPCVPWAGKGGPAATCSRPPGSERSPRAVPVAGVLCVLLWVVATGCPLLSKLNCTREVGNHTKNKLPVKSVERNSAARPHPGRSVTLGGLEIPHKLGWASSSTLWLRAVVGVTGLLPVQ